MDSLALPPTQTGTTAPPGQILSNEQLSLLKPLIPEESWRTFKVHFEEIHFFWAKLLLDTSVTGTNATILNALAAIRIVDSILSDEGLPRWKHRFAYIRRDFSVKHDVLENISHQAIQACRQAIGDSGVFPI
ncbi:hypothetical protein H633G_11597 [Metarhizium anisopliae BRIP 53284]|nr:hypothetical protein H633G_11597 [Metarhizium anisopliae BRIP 53284]